MKPVLGVNSPACKVGVLPRGSNTPEGSGVYTLFTQLNNLAYKYSDLKYI